MHDQVAEFVAEARRYCGLIENPERSPASAFDKECLVALARLCERILRLPSADPSDPELPERISHEEWQEVRDRIARRIEHDEHWEVFEPFAKNKPDPIYGSISDDLADTWRELKAGLSILDTGSRTASWTLCGIGDFRLGRTGASMLLVRSEH
jgi:Domain of unknown function (DUF5063)